MANPVPPPLPPPLPRPKAPQSDSARAIRWGFGIALGGFLFALCIMVLIFGGLFSLGVLGAIFSASAPLPEETSQDDPFSHIQDPSEEYSGLLSPGPAPSDPVSTASTEAPAASTDDDRFLEDAHRTNSTIVVVAEVQPGRVLVKVYSPLHDSPLAGWLSEGSPLVGDYYIAQVEEAGRRIFVAQYNGEGSSSIVLNTGDGYAFTGALAIPAYSPEEEATQAEAAPPQPVANAYVTLVGFAGDKAILEVRSSQGVTRPVCGPSDKAYGNWRVETVNKTGNAITLRNRFDDSTVDVPVNIPVPLP